MADKKKNNVKKKTITVSENNGKKKKKLSKPATLTLGGETPSLGAELKEIIPISLDGVSAAKRRKKSAGSPRRRAQSKPAPESEKLSLEDGKAAESAVSCADAEVSIRAARSEKEAESVKEIPAPPESAAKKERPILVTFVCTGNTCRSAMAQYLFEDYLKDRGDGGDFRVASAGLSALEGADMSENAKAALAELGIVGFHHFATRLTKSLADSSDFIVCMTEGHLRAIGMADGKVTTVGRLTGGSDVPDPYGGSLEDYRRVAAYLKYACADVYSAALRACGR